jgi:putative transposase
MVFVGRVNFSTEQIIIKLREIEIFCGQGKTVADACRQVGITEQTYYRWRNKYGGMNGDDAKRLKELEKENLRLKRIVADLTLDNAILKEVNKGNF